MVAAEAFFLPLGDLLNFPTAILAGCCFPGEDNGRHGCHVPVDIVPAAERLYCVYRNANRLGNLAIAVSSRTEFYDLCFLIIGHILLGSFRGIGLVVSPSLTTEKFNPHRYGIKKAACRLSKEKPTGHTCSEKSFIVNGREHEEHEKSYYIINFANENGVYKNVYYIRRDRNLLFLCVLVFRLNLCCVIKAYPARTGFEPSQPAVAPLPDFTSTMVNTPMLVNLPVLS